MNDPDGWMALRDAGGIVGLLDGTLWPDGWVPDAAVMLGDFVGVRRAAMANAETVGAFRRLPPFH